jgi:hypothetical protein
MNCSENQNQKSKESSENKKQNDFLVLRRRAKTYISPKIIFSRQNYLWLSKIIFAPSKCVNIIFDFGGFCRIFRRF